MHQSFWTVIQTKHKPWTFWSLSITSYHIQFLPFHNKNYSLCLQEVLMLSDSWFSTAGYVEFHWCLYQASKGSHTPIIFQHLSVFFLFKTQTTKLVYTFNHRLNKPSAALPDTESRVCRFGGSARYRLGLSPLGPRLKFTLCSRVKYGQQFLPSPRRTVAHTIKLSYLIQLLGDGPCVQDDLGVSPAEDTPYRLGGTRSLTGH